MLRRGRHLALLCAAAAIGASGRLLAEDQSVEDRLVHVFRTQCMATLGRPTLIGPELRKLGWTQSPGDVLEFVDDRGIVELTNWTEPNDQALRRLHVAVVEGANYPTRVCRVVVPFADKAPLNAALARQLALGEPTASVAHENSAEADIKRWSTRVEGMDAKVELRTPAYSGAPDYSLTLVVQKR